MKSAEFIEKYIPDLNKISVDPDLTLKKKLILQSALYWYEWNLLALEKSTETIQLEHIGEELPRLCEMLGIEFDADVLDKISSRTNERGSPEKRSRTSDVNMSKTVSSMLKARPPGR